LSTPPPPLLALLPRLSPPVTAYLRLQENSLYEEVEDDRVGLCVEERHEESEETEEEKVKSDSVTSVTSSSFERVFPREKWTRDEDARTDGSLFCFVLLMVVVVVMARGRGEDGEEEGIEVFRASLYRKIFRLILVSLVLVAIFAFDWL